MTFNGTTTTWDGNATGTFAVSSGAIGGTGALDLQPGNFNWSGGTIGGAGTLTTNSGVATLLSNSLTLNRPWVSKNGFTMNAGSSLAINNGGSLTTSGAQTININSGAANTISGTGKFTNASGSVVHTSPGPGGTTTISAPLDNAGKISLESGALVVSGSGTDKIGRAHV